MGIFAGSRRVTIGRPLPVLLRSWRGYVQGRGHRPRSRRDATPPRAMLRRGAASPRRATESAPTPPLKRSAPGGGDIEISPSADTRRQRRQRLHNIDSGYEAPTPLRRDKFSQRPKCEHWLRIMMIGAGRWLQSFMAQAMILFYDPGLRNSQQRLWDELNGATRTPFTQICIRTSWKQWKSGPRAWAIEMDGQNTTLLHKCFGRPARFRVGAAVQPWAVRPRQAAPPVSRGLRDTWGGEGASKRQGYADPVRTNSSFAKLVSCLDLYVSYDLYLLFCLHQFYMLISLIWFFVIIAIIILIDLISLVWCCITKPIVVGVTPW